MCRPQWWGLMTLACLWSLLPRNCLQQYASRSWDGCTKEGGEGNLIFTQRVNMVLKVFREQVLCSASKPLLSCPPWLCFSWTAQQEHYTRRHEPLPRQTTHYRRTSGLDWGKWKENWFMLFLFIILSICMVGYHLKCFDIGANTLNDLNAETDMILYIF